MLWAFVLTLRSRAVGALDSHGIQVSQGYEADRGDKEVQDAVGRA